MNSKQQSVIVDRLVDQAVNKKLEYWRMRCVAAVTASVASDLLDKWGWSPEQVSELIQTTNTNFENILDKLVTIEDYVKWAEERDIRINNY